MTDIDNPKNVIGMGSLLEDDDDDLDIKDLERSIVTGISSQKKKDNVDLAGDYSRDIEKIGREFGFGKRDDDFSTQKIDQLLQNDSQKKTVFNNISNNQSNHSLSDSYKAPYNLDDSDDSDNETNVKTSNKPWSIDNPSDEQLIQITNEEKKKEHVNKVLKDIEVTSPDEAEFLQREDEEDEMAKITEQVDLLRGNLDSEGVDLSRIAEIGPNTTRKEAKSILRILQIKNDRLRYCDFFEEGILAAAYGLEGVFNGKREILGSQIDLTGYSDTVKIKLRRMRYDTSNFISDVMQGYNISPGWRIALELIPSLFLYSRDRKLTARDNLITDENFKNAMQHLESNKT